MKVTKKLILAFVAVAAAGAIHAQTSSGNSPSSASTTIAAPPVGVLGQSYEDATFGFEDIKHTSHDAYHLGVSGNQPVNPYLDARLGYTYEWLQHNPRGHSNELSATTIAYTSFDGVKPFVTAKLGYEWDRFAGRRSNFGNWGAGVGVEIPVGVISLTPSILYADDFKTPAKSSQDVSYGAEANYWVTKATAVYAGLDYTDVRKSDFDSWNYNAGLRLKF